MGVTAPNVSTFRRALSAFTGDDSDPIIDRRAAGRLATAPAWLKKARTRRAIAVDSKALRGSRDGESRARMARRARASNDSIAELLSAILMAIWSIPSPAEPRLPVRRPGRFAARSIAGAARATPSDRHRCDRDHDRVHHDQPARSVPMSAPSSRNCSNCSECGARSSPCSATHPSS